MKKNLLLVFTIAIALYSCNNSSDELFDLTTTKESGVLNFTYKGVFYSSNYEVDENDEIKIANQEVVKIYSEIQEIPTLCTVIGDTILFYDSNEERLNDLNPSVRTSSRAANDVKWGLTAYTSRNYQGAREEYTGRGSHRQNTIQYNNNWDSLIMTMSGIDGTSYCEFTFYENGDCKAGRTHVVPLSGTGDRKEIKALKDIFRSNWGRHWGNEISSFSVYCR